MTTNANPDAVSWADNLLEALIKTQPELCTVKGPVNKSHGVDVAEFITALRNGLIAMYTAQPHE